MDNLLYWLIAGAVAGVVARIVLPPMMPRSRLGYVVVGIMGGVIGGWLLNVFTAPAHTGGLANLIVAFAGAAVLFALRAARCRRIAVRR